MSARCLICGKPPDECAGHKTRRPDVREGDVYIESNIDGVPVARWEWRSSKWLRVKTFDPPAPKEPASADLYLAVLRRLDKLLGEREAVVLPVVLPTGGRAMRAPSTSTHCDRCGAPGISRHGTLGVSKVENLCRVCERVRVGKEAAPEPVNGVPVAVPFVVGMLTGEVFALGVIHFGPSVFAFIRGVF